MKVKRISSIKSLESEKTFWNKFLLSSRENSIFLTHEWFSSWWKCFGKNHSMEILVVEDETGNIYGIAPFMSSKNCLQFIASPEVSDYCDFLTRKNKGDVFFETLISYLKSHYPFLDRLELINMRKSSSSLSIMSRLAESHGFTCEYAETEVAPFLELPSSYEDYLNRLDKKKRHELKRKLKRTEFLKEIRTHRIRDPERLQVFIEGFIRLHKRSSSSKKKFWKTEGMIDFFHEIIGQFSCNNWVELNSLFYGQKIIAAVLNFSYSDILYFYNSAYDREYAWYNPGFFLFHHCLKQAIHEGKRRADFLRGNEKYKYDLGARTSKLCKVSINFMAT